MTRTDLLNLIRPLLTEFDLTMYYDADGRRNDHPAPPVVDYLIDRVGLTCEQYELDCDDDELIETLAADLNMAACQIDRIAGDLILRLHQGTHDGQK